MRDMSLDDTHDTPPVYEFERRFKIVIPPREACKNESVEITTSGIEYYFADLSEAGVYSPQSDKGIYIPIGKHTTIFQSEVIRVSSQTENYH